MLYPVTNMQGKSDQFPRSVVVGSLMAHGLMGNVKVSTDQRATTKTKNQCTREKPAEKYEIIRFRDSFGVIELCKINDPSLPLSVDGQPKFHTNSEKSHFRRSSASYGSLQLLGFAR